MGLLSDVVSPVRNFLCVGAKHLQSITVFVTQTAKLESGLGFFLGDKNKAVTGVTVKPVKRSQKITTSSENAV